MMFVYSISVMSMENVEKSFSLNEEKYTLNNNVVVAGSKVFVSFYKNIIKNNDKDVAFIKYKVCTDDKKIYINWIEKKKKADQELFRLLITSVFDHAKDMDCKYIIAKIDFSANFESVQDKLAQHGFVPTVIKKVSWLKKDMPGF